MNINWNTSVTELIRIFRGALLSIIPWLEKAKIKWNEGEAYDDWDNIVESLYLNLVCSTLNGEVSVENNIAKYNFTYSDYTTINFIEVKRKGNSEKRYIFVAFQSGFSPLDSVKVAIIDEVNKVVGHAIFKFDSLEFIFVKNITGNQELINSLYVTL
jgi:hypothetical protein